MWFNSSQAVTRLGIGLSLANLVLAASAGAILRLAFVTEIPGVEYRHFLHAHSHVVILGWATLILFTLLHATFLNAARHRREYGWLFLLCELTVIGMAVSFAMEGYAFSSTFCSSLFVLSAYRFIYLFLRDLRHGPGDKPPVVLARTALYFFLLSTVFLWSIGPVIALHLRFSRVFYLLVQAFLHFMINGWFIFAFLALVFARFTTMNAPLDRRKFKRFYRFLVVSTIFTYALAVAWTDPETWVFVINSTGVILQAIALLYFLGILRAAWPRCKQNMRKLARGLLAASMIAFVLKIIIQSMVVLPFLATVAYTIRYFVIGFLHLVLLGVLTLGVFALLLDHKSLPPASTLVRLGVILLCSGIALTELLLFTQGVMAWGALGFIPSYYLILFLVTCLLPIAAALLLVAYTRHRNKLSSDQEQAS